jgi:ATP-dependent protease ClpP protease subunit
MEDDTNKLLGEVTNKPAEWWEKEQKVDLYLNAQEALDLGVIDEII